MIMQRWTGCPLTARTYPGVATEAAAMTIGEVNSSRLRGRSGAAAFTRR